MKEEKNKVGRPKLANSNLVKNAVIIIEIAIIGVLSLIIGGVVTLKSTNIGVSNLKGYASKNGDKAISYSSKTNMLIIGDSRICEMQRVVNNASYVAVWGGHYGYSGKGIDNQIDSSSRINKMKEYIDKIVKEKGSARVYVIATVNDYNGNGSYTSALNNQVKLINKLYNYNKKISIYGGSLIAERNGKSVSSYNNALKSKIGNKYINIKPSSVGYIDSAHFNNNTTKKIYNILLNNNTPAQTAKPALPKLVCTYNGKTVKANGNTSKVKSNTLTIEKGKKFTCKMGGKYLLAISKKCNGKETEKYKNVNSKDLSCNNISNDVSIRGQNGNSIERIYVNVVAPTTETKKSTTTTTQTTTKTTTQTTTQTTTKTSTTTNITTTQTTTKKITGCNATIKPGTNQVMVIPECGRNYNLVRINLYKENGAVIARRNYNKEKEITFNKLSKDKYKVGLVYYYKNKKYDKKIDFEITDGLVYKDYKFNLSEDEKCYITKNIFKDDKLTYKINCGAKASVNGAILYDNTLKKTTILLPKNNYGSGYAIKKTFKNKNFLNVKNDYHIRIYWTTKNNSNTGVTKFARSYKTEK